MLNDSQIRKLTPEDADSLFLIYERVCAGAQHPIGPHWNRAQLTDECTMGEGWLLFDGAQPKQIAAFILFRNQGPALDVTFLGCDPALQKRGLMRRLMRTMQSHLPNHSEIWLEVHEQNQAARRLYASAGFQEVGKRPKYYSDGGSAILYSFGHKPSD